MKCEHAWCGCNGRFDGGRPAPVSDFTPQEHADYIRRAVEDMPPSAFGTIWAERELLIESLDVIDAALVTLNDWEVSA